MYCKQIERQKGKSMRCKDGVYLNSCIKKASKEILNKFKSEQMFFNIE